MNRKITYICLALITAVLCSSCSGQAVITDKDYADLVKIQDMTVETVDYDDPDSLAKYLYSLMPLSYLSHTSNESEYPSLDHVQYIYICEYRPRSHSVLFDFVHGKVSYDSLRSLVVNFPGVPEMTRDMTEGDVDLVDKVLTEQDIFSWKIQYDGTRGKTYGDYEGKWIISIVFDDGSYFQTSGEGDYSSAWPDKYIEVRDVLFDFGKS